jgi:hypothetical protein
MYKGSDTCLEKSADDEPIFVLAARDSLAVDTVVAWINLAQKRKVSQAKIADAVTVLSAMMVWQQQHPPRLPD